MYFPVLPSLCDKWDNSMAGTPALIPIPHFCSSSTTTMMTMPHGQGFTTKHFHLGGSWGVVVIHHLGCQKHSPSDASEGRWVRPHLQPGIQHISNTQLPLQRAIDNEICFKVCGNTYYPILIFTLTVRTHRRGYQGSSGFRCRLQLVCCTYLLTLSEYFGVSRAFGVGWIPILAFVQEIEDEARWGSAYRRLLKWGHRNKLLKWGVTCASWVSR